VIGHFTDAGLAEARSAVRIPVIGLGEATILLDARR
jgi:Asp/Glu/hydantoin racemase